MKSIVLFGGAFDPPHFGHKLVIEQALQQIQLDELWVMPSYASTFLKKLSPVAHRLSMSQLLARELRDKRVTVSTIEIEQQTSGSTIDTLNYLKENLPLDWKFSFLMGSDQLASFTKWERYGQLLGEMQFYVYPRNGFGFEPWFNQMKQLKSAHVSDISSTQIKVRLSQMMTISNLVPRYIEAYILKHRLYRT